MEYDTSLMERWTDVFTVGAARLMLPVDYSYQPHVIPRWQLQLFISLKSPISFVSTMIEVTD